MALLFAKPVLLGAQLLSALAAHLDPLFPIVAHSERHFPVYLKGSPFELATGKVSPNARRSLPAESFDRAALGFSALRNRWVKSGRLRENEPALVEAWPYRDDFGRYAWAAARWKPSESDDWRWIEGEVRNARDAIEVRRFRRPPGQLKTIQLPVEFNPRIPLDFQALFKDALGLNDLYAKPLAGDCVWTDASGAKVYGAWADPNALESLQREVLSSAEPLICRYLPMPARWEGRPKTWVLEVREGAVRWPADFRGAEGPATGGNPSARGSCGRSSPRSNGPASEKTSAPSRERRPCPSLSPDASCGSSARTAPRATISSATSSLTWRNVIPCSVSRPSGRSSLGEGSPKST